MTKEEMNKDKAEMLKMVFEYKNNISTLKNGLGESKLIFDSTMLRGLSDESSIKLKNACIELGMNEIDRLQSLVFLLIDSIDSAADIFITAYGDAMQKIETED